MRKIISLLLTLALILSLSTAAYAAGYVTYDADANKFIFAPGTKDSPTNLFGNFQNVMPGDSVMEQILIRNDVSNKVKIKVYMRSLGAMENTDNFLSQMELKVQQRGDSILFAAPANESAQLTDWVYLGTVYSGGEIVLDVTLNVPITMGNGFQDSIGYIDWEFKVEELPIADSDPKLPKTGDSSDILLYSLTMGISLFSLILLLLAVKRRRQACH